jgi:hypothetical protein
LNDGLATANDAAAASQCDAAGNPARDAEPASVTVSSVGLAGDAVSLASSLESLASRF